MELSRKKIGLYSALLVGLPCVLAMPAYAAKPINLRHQPVTALAVQSQSTFKEVSRVTDFNNTTHVRIQQTYSGYPVFGADAVLHIPHASNNIKSTGDALNAVKTNQGSMNGIVYQDLKTDLDKAPADAFSSANLQKATSLAVSTFENKVGSRISPKELQSNLIIFIDKANKAHWAYKVNFYVDPLKQGTAPAKPVYIVDAITHQVYKQWDDIKTVENSDDLKIVKVDSGGFGGNIKMGKLVYDGLEGNLAKLTMMRDARKKSCMLKNKDVIVKDYESNKVMQFKCAQTDPDHNDVYWGADFDAVNDGYSPGNDALFGGAVIKDMYKQWYGTEVLTENGKPMLLTMVVHVRNYDNAYWDGKQMTFGDGEDYFYPLTSLGVAAHEISHGFTEQHSDLVYSGQSGGMNEAYSDMAAQAAEVFAYGKNSWQIGPEIFKAEDEALRYMDQPSKDCKGGTPGNDCSIDNMSQYNDDQDVHYTSGIYNRTFYLMGTADGWNTRKAFDVMLKANANYWTSNTSFAEGACGVIQAAKDYGYDTATVLNAFKTVGVDTSAC